MPINHHGELTQMFWLQMWHLNYSQGFYIICFRNKSTVEREHYVLTMETY